MTRLAYHRPARISPPAVPEEKVALPNPPQVDRNNGGGSMWLTLLLPVLSSMGMAGYMVALGRPLLIVIGIAFALISVTTAVAMRWQMRNNNRRASTMQRFRYLAHLATTRRQARDVAAKQRLLAVWTHPGPHRLWSIATGRRRLWERRQSDADFLVVRLGHGRGPLATPLELSRLDPMTAYDSEALAAAKKLVKRLGTVGAQPALTDLGRA